MPEFGTQPAARSSFDPAQLPDHGEGSVVRDFRMPIAESVSGTVAVGLSASAGWSAA